MKNLFTAILFILLFAQPAFAQNRFYNFTVYGGINPKQIPVQAALIVNREDPMNEFIFNLKEVSKSYTLGLRKNFRFSSPFYGTLGMDYSRQTQKYSQWFTHQPALEDQEFELTTTSHMISVPAGVGLKIKMLDITSGLVAKYAFSPEISEQQPMGIEIAKSKMEFGWYTGIGISVDRTRLGIQYEAALKRYGHNLIYKQNALELNSVPGNFRFTVGFSF